MMSNEYTVVIVSSADDLKNIDFKIPYVFKNLHPKKLVIISSQSAINSHLKYNPNIQILDEDEILIGLSIQGVKDELISISGTDRRANWYFQQFLKMSYAYLSTTDYYLIWDADTIPLKEINFIDPNGAPQFTIKTEYHQPYFATIKKILNYEKAIDGSFIAEHMLINKYLMQELIEKIIENQYNSHNDITYVKTDFWKIILNNIDLTSLFASGFSEFETYGTFVTHEFPNKYKYRTLQTCRNASKILGLQPSKDLLDWAANDYEIISLEKWTKKSRFFLNISKIHFFRKIFRMKTLMLLTKLL